MQEPINRNRRRFLSGVAMTIAATQLDRVAFARRSSGGKGALSFLNGNRTWLNSPPLTATDLAGKVVLVDFWTYSCINWRRQLPYVRAWADRYKEHGLVVIGAHAPEFSFERNIDNVRLSVKDMRIDYPVAIDNDYSIWRSFSNEYWPGLYFVDAQGRLRHHAFGEGEYQQSEKVIQTLLAEAGARDIGGDLAQVDPQGAEAAADWSDLRSGENYVGYGQTLNFSSPGGIKTDRAHVYAADDHLKLNCWSLSGNWTIGKEAIVSNQSNARISYRYHARDLHLVMGPAVPGAPEQFRVLIDGEVPRTAYGVDLDQDGVGRVIEPRMYQLIRRPGPVVDRKFEIEFVNPGAQVFSFTFG